MVIGYALAEHGGIARVGGLLGLLWNRLLLLLRHLDGRTVVLLVLMRMLHPAIAQIRDVRVGEIRTHAMARSSFILFFSSPPLVRTVFFLFFCSFQLFIKF